jgi:hypothetical protein
MDSRNDNLAKHRIENTRDDTNAPAFVPVGCHLFSVICLLSSDLCLLISDKRGTNDAVT